MFLLKFFFAFLWLTLAVDGENVKTCPRFCKCDSYLLLNRAQCSSKHLISAEVDIPYQVQILDLSYNDITVVDKNCFKNFFHLKYLNLSNNALHTLDLEAFSKLLRLTELDLSNNRLEYLDERIFSKNKFLRKLNLEGNKFMSFRPKTLLKSTSLKELNLRNSQINFLNSELLNGLDNLEELDLSGNLLNNFNIEDFKLLFKLKKLNLSENFIKCNGAIREKLRKLIAKGVNVTMNSCSLEDQNKFTANSKQKFEKMIMVASSREEESDVDALNGNMQWRFQLESDEVDEYYDEAEGNSLKIGPKNEWLRLDPDIVLCAQNFVLCQEYRSCLQALNKASREQRLQREQCLSDDVKFAFFLGIAVGISTVVIIISFIICLKSCIQDKREDATLDVLALQPMARPTSQMPPNIRRQSRRRATATTSAHPLVRYEGPVTENFLSRLFGRPARQQYYRTINQNTATLIRRLSRSNLFNNRLSQHILDRQNSSENPNSPNAEDENYIPSAPRPETPPPSYKDIVINNCGPEK